MALAGSLALLTGCGGDDVALEDYAAAAGDICADVQREADGMALPTAGPGLADALRGSAALARDEVELLIDLRRPSDARDQVDAWIEALGRRVTALEEYAASVAAAGGAPVAIPDDLAAATTDAATLAAELGIERCGAGVDTPITSPGQPGPSVPAPQEPPLGAPAPPVTNDIGIPPDETTTQDQ